jgi:hypothetical protein
MKNVDVQNYPDQDIKTAKNVRLFIIKEWN